MFDLLIPQCIHISKYHFVNYKYIISHLSIKIYILKLLVRNQKVSMGSVTGLPLPASLMVLSPPQSLFCLML